MNITADTVKQLRERTGAGMMECKKALVETKGDLEAAAELMRKSGLAKADKKAARVAAEGTVAIERTGNHAALVEINCETDLGGRSDEFQAFAKGVAAAALRAAPSSLEDLLKLSHEGSTLDERRRALIAKIGENIAVRRFVRVSSPGPLGTYIHGARIGSVAALQGGDESLARDIAMHVAAVILPSSMSAMYRPTYSTRNERFSLNRPRVKRSPQRSSPRWWKAACASTWRKSRC